jgi:hypothetical protein
VSIRFAIVGLLLLPQAAHAAEGSTAFVRGGLSSVGFESSASSYRFEAEDGGGLNLAGGLRLANGFAVRAELVGSKHDGFRFCADGLGCGKFDEEVSVGERRLVFLYAPMLSERVMLEVGGGLESISSDTGDVESKAGGLVAEGNVVFLTSEAWRFNIGLALMGLEDDDTNEGVGGGEVRVGFVARAGSVELGAMLRALHLEQDDDDSSGSETDVVELRLTLGTSWDF